MTDRPDDPYRQGSNGEPPAGSQPPYGTPPSNLPYGPQGQQPPQPPAYGSPPPAYGSGQPQQPPSGAAPPYGAPPYAGTPYGYQAPSPEQSSVRTQAIIALVANAVVLVLACFMALPSIGGVITAGIALGRVNTDVDSARRLVRWSWGLLVLSIVLGVLIIVAVIAAGATFDSTTTGTDTSGY